MIVKSINLGKIPNDKDNEQEFESSKIQFSIFSFSRTGIWHLNNRGKRNSKFEHLEIDKTFNVLGKQTFYRDLEKLQSWIFRSYMFV